MAATIDRAQTIAHKVFRRRKLHIPIFRLFYSTTFIVLFVILCGLLLVTAADTIYQSFANHQYWDVVIIAAAYVLAFLISVFLYATRLYAVRAHMAAIPRIDFHNTKYDHFPQRVRQVVLNGLTRSAAITYDAHPRPREEYALRNPGHAKPHWGEISNRGWSSIDSPMPDMQFEPIIKELPSLFEAKAVSLCPTPSSQIVSVLQRQPSWTLRAYLDHLVGLEMLSADHIQPFLAIYERARYAARPPTEKEFNILIDRSTRLISLMVAPQADLLQSRFTSFNASTFSIGFSNRKIPIIRRPSPDIDADSPQQTGNPSFLSFQTSGTVEHTPFHTPYLQQSSTAPSTPLRRPNGAPRLDSTNDSGSVIHHAGTVPVTVNTEKSPRALWTPDARQTEFRRSEDNVSSSPQQVESERLQRSGRQSYSSSLRSGDSVIIHR